MRSALLGLALACLLVACQTTAPAASTFFNPLNSLDGRWSEDSDVGLAEQQLPAFSSCGTMIAEKRDEPTAASISSVAESGAGDQKEKQRLWNDEF
jgi:hypothetical protein